MNRQTIVVDYSVKPVLVTSVTLASRCQTCGRPSEATHCPDCAPLKKVEFDGHRKTFSHNGCNVLMNGKLLFSVASTFAAEFEVIRLRKKWAFYNLECIKRGVL